MVAVGTVAAKAVEVAEAAATEETVAAEVAEAEATSGIVEEMASEIGSEALKELPSEIVGNEVVGNMPAEATKLSKSLNPSDVIKGNLEGKTIESLIESSLGSPEGIRKLLEKHPEKAELWKSQMESVKLLQSGELTPLEARSAQARLSQLKGQLMETSIKDSLKDFGFSVEDKQSLVKGELGGTRPDIVAENITDSPIRVFGMDINPGEILSGECKCGNVEYIKGQLEKHIPNQLSGQEGTRTLFTTSDINGVSSDLVKNVCNEYGAQLINLDVSVADVEKAIMEVAKA